MGNFSFKPKIQRLRSTNATLVAAIAVRTWSSGFPRSHCRIAWRVTNLIVSSCNGVSTLICESFRRRSKRSTAPVSSLTRFLSPSISVCCSWHSVPKLVRSTSWLACSWASTPPLVRRERLLGAWWLGCSNFHCPNSFVRSIKWLNIFSLTCSFTAGRVPFWRNQIPNVKKKLQQQQQQQRTKRKKPFNALLSN
mgnify:CR=1 FL=1